MNTCNMIHEHDFKNTMNKMINSSVSDNREHAISVCKTLKGDISLSQIAKGTEKTVILPVCSRGARLATFHTHSKLNIPSPADTFNIIRFSDAYGTDEHHCIGLKDDKGYNKITCFNYKHKPIKKLLVDNMIDDEVPLSNIIKVVEEIDSDIKDKKGQYVDSCSVQ